MLIRFAPWMFAVLCSGGCSLILDTGDLPRVPDAPFDAPPPDAPPLDADRSRFHISGLHAQSHPAVEGMGWKGTPLVLRFAGDEIVDASVSAEWSPAVGGDQIVVTDVFAADTHREIDVGIRIPVRTDQFETTTSGPCDAMIHFEFTQTGGDPAAVDVPLTCLDEITNPSTAASGHLYSRIDFTSAQHFGGTAPVVMKATEDITINAILDVDGSGRTGGPGGCDGGLATAPGDCAGAGGQGGGGGTLDAGGGGGGAGYLDFGSNGGNESNRGSPEGNEMLVPLGGSIDNVENRGAGGGGGGQGTGGSPGAGGGGGGIITFVAGGEVHVGTMALVRSKGGNGGNGSGGLGLTSGGGGGGSGGAILIRSGAGVVYDGAAMGWLDANKGTGGTSPGNAGGAGAFGRIRVDQPIAAPAVSSMVVNGGITAGPAWVPVMVPFSTDSTITLQLRVKPGTYGIFVNGDPWSGAAGGNLVVNTPQASLTVAGLVSGYNQICALYKELPGAGNVADRDEAKTCVDIVYTPGG